MSRERGYADQAVRSGGITDGDKGDITVSASGATWTIDNSVVTTSKLGGDITVAGKALLDDADAMAQRATLGLGTLATQSGTFSGSSSGTNTGDQTSIAGISGTIAQFNTACSDADFATGGGSATGTNTGDNATNSQYSSLVSNATHTGDATGAIALTVVKIQGKDFPTLAEGDDQKYPKYNHGTNAFVMSTVSAALPDFIKTKMAATADTTLEAGYSAMVGMRYTVASGIRLTIGSLAEFRVL